MEGECRGLGASGQMFLGCPQGASFSPDPGLSVPLAFDHCLPSLGADLGLAPHELQAFLLGPPRCWDYSMHYHAVCWAFL